MLRIEQLSKSFGDRSILDRIDLEVDRGEIVFILGQSGTGKSVLLKCLVGLLQADSGKIWIDGVDVTHFSESQFFGIRRKCGLIFQKPALFDFLNVRENILFGLSRLTEQSPEVNLQVARWALKQVQMSGFEDRHPATLSFGEQKRVSLARALALQPQMLLFDEPTTGLDPSLSFSINRLIQEVARQSKTATLVVSHDMDCALDIADRIIVLHRGRILDQGSPGEILNSSQDLVQAFLSEAKGGRE
jgi:phospholipid/cholesterol/gamma-HCH transport system ATP-binding protein